METRTILLVEDESAVRNLLARMLRLQGFRVVEAASGAEAEVAMAAEGEGIDLLITDLFMADTRGPELARRLTAVHPTLPVIFISGNASAMPDDDGGVAPRRVIEKPFSSETLVRHVREALDRS